MSSTVAQNGYLADFQALSAGATAAPEWLQRLRAGAFESFEGLGWPSQREESWRYTNLAPLAKRHFRHAVQRPAGHPEDKELDGYLLWDELAIRMVFVDGHFAPGFSQLRDMPDGLRVRTLAEALAEDPDRLEGRLAQAALPDRHPLVALNTAFLADGAVIELAPGAALEHPIHVLHVSTNRGEALATHPRCLVLAGAGSQATLVETFAGPEGGAYFSNPVTEVFLEANAALDHYRDQEESPEAWHVGFTAVELERDSRFRSHSLALGGALSRSEVTVRFHAEGGRCTLNGLYYADGERHVDNQTFVDHAVPHCYSEESYRGVLDGRARGVFNGRVIVRPDAQKTEAHQQNKNLLLSRTAHADTKPQLEIFADDVRCTHGATIGQLDEDAIFYLQSRGIEKSSARSLLTWAFTGAITESIRVAPLRCRIDQLLFHRLEQSPAGVRAGGRLEGVA